MRPKGFTLIELMVIVAIIAFALAIFLHRFQRHREQQVRVETPTGQGVSKSPD